MIALLQIIFLTIVLVCSICFPYSAAQTMEYSQNPHYFRVEEKEGLSKRIGSLKYGKDPEVLE